MSLELVINNVTPMLTAIKEVGMIFTEFPFILVPIAAVTAVGYKYSGRVFAWVKGRMS